MAQGAAGSRINVLQSGHTASVASKTPREWMELPSLVLFSSLELVFTGVDEVVCFGVRSGWSCLLRSEWRIVFLEVDGELSS